MKLPHVQEPEKYRGLYVYDFGEWTALGYTADEITVLLESADYRSGKVYRIHRAWPDGRMELQGVLPQRLQIESGMLFYRGELDAARADFTALRDAAEREPPPCRASIQLAQRAPGTDAGRYVTALVYPADYENEIGQWLLSIDYAGGDPAECGPSHMTDYRNEEETILDRQQLWSTKSTPSRSAEQVLASVRQAVQR